MLTGSSRGLRFSHSVMKIPYMHVHVHCSLTNDPILIIVGCCSVAFRIYSNGNTYTLLGDVSMVRRCFRMYTSRFDAHQARNQSQRTLNGVQNYLFISQYGL